MTAPESLFDFLFASDPQISPDGQATAFVLTRIEEEDPAKPDPNFARPRYRSAVHVGTPGVHRAVTSGEKRDTSPRWSPDGQTLAFVSDRTGKPQLYLLPLSGGPVSGGEARQVTRFETGVSDPKWSPDGRTVAVLTRLDAVDRRAERGEARIVTDFIDKFNGQGFLPQTPAALVLVDAASGEARVLHRPAVGAPIGDYVWKPDGTGLLFSAALSERGRAMWQEELHEVSLAGETRVLSDWAAPISGLAPHVDGRRVAFVGRPKERGNTEDPHLFEFDLSVTPAPARRLDGGMDVPVGNLVAGDLHVGAFPARPAWDGETVLALYTVGGSAGLFGVHGGQGTPRVFTEGRVVSAFTSASGSLAHVEESPVDVPDVVLGGRRVTDLGAGLGSFPRRAPTRVVARSEDGTEVEGWVLRPDLAGIPALLNIHGGPHTAYGYGFQHEFQLMADAGYAVCYANPRGSVGYGQAFSEAIRGRWGTVDMADLMAFFDACHTQFPDLDPARSGVMGGSYGGLMTNWIIGHSDRFRVAVTDRSICNLVSFGGTSDIGARFWHDELGLDIHRSADAAGLWDMSPLKYVEHVRTPCLIIHSEEDHRCPVEQAEQWFTALKLLDVETRLVRFPGEDHELSRSGRPDRRVVRLQEYLRWLDAHLGVGG